MYFMISLTAMAIPSSIRRSCRIVFLQCGRERVYKRKLQIVGEPQLPHPSSFQKAAQRESA